MMFIDNADPSGFYVRAISAIACVAILIVGMAMMLHAIRNGRSGSPSSRYSDWEMTQTWKVPHDPNLPPQMIGHSGMPKLPEDKIGQVDGELKVWPKYFDALWDGRKKWELRLNDRDFKVGQVWLLREYQPVYINVNRNKISAMPQWEEKGSYLGRAIYVKITYVIDKDSPFGLLPNWVIWSFRELNRVESHASSEPK